MLVSGQDIKIVKQSHLYETSPVDYLDQPAFLNNVVEIEIALRPHELLARTREVEKSLGTMKSVPKGPRLIDIDILTYNDEVIDTDDLKIPHPAMCNRKFVLIPLLEIAPNAHCIRDHRYYRECLQSLNDPTQTVEIYHG